VADRLSNAQLERLGKRLIATERPTEADLGLLHELLLSRSEQLERSIARVHDALGLSPSSRVKNTGTILEKLRRQGGWTLGGMQDLAGMRVVGDFDLNGQDVVVDQLRDLFAGEARPPKVIDRRVEPMHGYRAVHVIVFPDGAPLEIQVRTARQHEWAELFEKLADSVGRGIRYGEPPRHWRTAEQREAGPHELQELYVAAYRSRTALVELALATANYIVAFEELEQGAPDAPELEGFRQDIDRVIVDLRQAVEDLEDGAASA
jgi:ppGpp synthetase/RelA/SpoT-type nucleotidyltranferase